LRVPKTETKNGDSDLCIIPCRLIGTAQCQHRNIEARNIEPWNAQGSAVLPPAMSY